MAVSIGSRLGSYEILAAIGAGGMGQVKVLPEAFARDADRTNCAGSIHSRIELALPSEEMKVQNEFNS